MGELTSEQLQATVALEAEQELRIELTRALSVTLAQGTAEVAGVELAVGQPVSFTGGSVVVFSWYGAQLQLEGTGASWYTAAETPMREYVSVHAQLERKRDEAAAGSGRGPRVMVVGPRAAGKSFVCKLLLSWAARLGRAPLFVDLDAGRGELGVPGSVGAVAVTQASLQINPAPGTALPSPLVYYYGHDDQTANAPYYQQLCRALAGTVVERLANNAHEGASGLVINTAAWTDAEGGLDVLCDNAAKFGVDHILVLGQDRLFARLQSRFGGGGGGGAPTVVRLKRSGGAVEPTPEAQAREHSERVGRYFYGAKLAAGGFALSPSEVHIPMASMEIYRVVHMQLENSLLPIGAEARHQVLSLERVSAAEVPELAVLGVFNVLDEGAAAAAGGIDDALLGCNTAGFVHVQAKTTREDGSVDVTLMTPCPGDLPTNKFLLGELQWTGEY